MMFTENHQSPQTQFLKSARQAPVAKEVCKVDTWIKPMRLMKSVVEIEAHDVQY